MCLIVVGDGVSGEGEVGECLFFEEMLSISFFSVTVFSLENTDGCLPFCSI